MKLIEAALPCCPQVARLAVKLPQGRMEKMARRLARVMGKDEEEEGEEGDPEGEGNPEDELL